MADDARAYVYEHFSYARTTEPLRAWAADPRRAPDLGGRVDFQDIDFLTPAVDTAGQPTADRTAELEAEARALAEELAAIQRSKMWRFWMWTIAARRRLSRLFRVFARSS